jgi:hypothetical protein
MDRADDAPDFETITVERSRIGDGILGTDDVPTNPQARRVKTDGEVETVEPSTSTDPEAVEQFLADTDGERAHLIGIEVPVERTQCYTLDVTAISVSEDRTTVSATIERVQPECLDAPTVLTCFVRVAHLPAPDTVAVELGNPDGVS